MQILIPILVLLVVIGFLAIVIKLAGLIIWLLFGSRPNPDRGSAQTCAACGRELRPNQIRCTACGLDPRGQAASELRDLLAVMRQSVRFLQSEVIDRVTFENIQKAIKIRREALSGPSLAPSSKEPSTSLPGSIPVYDRTREPAPERVIEQTPPWIRLQEIFQGSFGSGDLNTLDREECLKLYFASEDHIQELPPEIRLRLARFLQIAGLGDEALKVWDQYLAQAGPYPEFGNLALEAGRLAIAREQPDKARRFLHLASNASALDETKRDAEALLLSVPSPTKLPATEKEVAISLSEESVPVLELAEQPGLAIVPVLAVESEPPVEEKPSSRRISAAGMFAAFMEQRNILWGELLGGLLIVGCSIMLVLHLWKTFEENPIYQFGIFVAVTAALFSAGLYSLNHWKLETTSRGLLVIATLLVPLNFLALAAQPHASPGVLEITIEIGSLLIFATLLWIVALVLAPGNRWQFALAVLGTSASQVLIPWFVGPGRVGDARTLTILAFLPVTCYLAGTGAILQRLSRQTPISIPQSHALLTALGAAVFALLIALGLVIYEAASAQRVLIMLSFPVAMAGMPLIAAGGLIHHGFSRQEHGGAMQTAGTAISLIGILVMLAAIVLAWQADRAVIAVCGLDFVVFTYIAFRFSLPVVHIFAFPTMAVGYLAGIHLVGYDHSANLGEAAFSEDFGIALASLVLLTAVASEAMVRLKRSEHGVIYAIGCGLLALGSLALVTFTGRTMINPELGVGLNGFYGAGLLFLNARWKKQLVASAGLALLVGAMLWALWTICRYEPEIWCAALAIEGFFMASVAAVLRRYWRHLGGDCPQTASQPAATVSDAYREALVRSAEVLAGLAIMAALWTGSLSMLWSLPYAITAACLCALYFLLALSDKRAGLARMAGLMFIALAVTTAGWASPVKGFQGVMDLIAACVGGAGLAMALLPLLSSRQIVPIGDGAEKKEPAASPLWFSILSSPSTDSAALAGILAMAMVTVSLLMGSSSLPVGTTAICGAISFLLALEYKTPALSWVGSALALFTFVLALAHPAHLLDITTLRLNFALLGHATLALLCSLGVNAVQHKGRGVSLTTNEQTSNRWRNFGHLTSFPLFQSALASSVLALPLCLTATINQVELFAACLFWLGILWLIVAWIRRWQFLFNIGQATLFLAVLYLTTSFLDVQDGTVSNGSTLLQKVGELRSLQVYGIGLSVLSMVWAVLRLLLRKQPTATFLLEGNPLATDLVLLCFLVVANLVISVAGIMPAVIAEQSAGYMATPQYLAAVAQASCPTAWKFAGLVALVLIVLFWDRRGTTALFGLIVMALTTSVLAAGLFASQQGVVSALTWMVATTYLAVSVIFWFRLKLRRLGYAFHWQVRLGRTFLVVSRAFLLVMAIAPVLLITIAQAFDYFQGEPPLQPLGGSFFAAIGWLPTLLGPLVIICIATTGHALRERFPSYAFAAGLLASLTLTGGYALWASNRLPASNAARAAFAVRLIQLATLSAAVWLIAWLAVRTWLSRHGRHLKSPFAPLLFQVQAALLVIGNAWLVGSAASQIVFHSFLPQACVTEAGSGLGWACLLCASVAFCFLSVCLGQSFRLRRAGWLGPAVICLLACSVANFWPGWSYRTLMLGLAGYSLAWVMVIWRWATCDTFLNAPTRRNAFDAAVYWVRLTALTVFLLSLKAAIWDRDELAAAAAISLVSPAVAIMALWLHREHWAFAAGLGFNLPGSLVVWHNYRSEPFGDWWPLLIQANVIAGSFAALLWITFRKRLYGESGTRLAATPLLALQSAFIAVTEVVVVSIGVVQIFVGPQYALSTDIVQIGGIWGAVALIVALFEVGYFVSLVKPENLVHLLCVGGLTLGGLIACSMCSTNTPNWPSYHTLGVAWTLVGLITFVAGRLISGAIPQELRAQHSAGDRIKRTLVSLKFLTPSREVIWGWVELVCLLVIVLASRNSIIPSSALYWPAGNFLATSFLMGALAVWSGQALHQYASGLLLNVVGAIIWLASWPATLIDLAYIQLLCFAIASSLWTGITLGCRTRIPVLTGAGTKWSFAHLSAGIAVIGMLVLAATAVILSLTGNVYRVVDGLTWLTLAATFGAQAICLWDPHARFSAAGLYLTSIASIGLIVQAVTLGPEESGLLLALTLGSYSTMAATLGFAWTHWRRQWQSLGIHKQIADSPTGWLYVTEVGNLLIVVGLSLWISINFSTYAARGAGSLALALSVPGAAILASRRGAPWRSMRFGTLVLGALIIAETGWALLDPGGHPGWWLWLHRSVMVLAALAAMSAFSSFLVPRFCSSNNDWSDAGRQLAPFLAVAAGMVLIIILIQEAALYAQLRIEPMALPATILVAGALISLVVSGIYFAVTPGPDPLGLPAEKRTSYVYAGEVIVVLTFVHLRLTLPGLFIITPFSQAWSFIIMAMAFAGAGIGEFCTRKKLAVLGEPLQRTGIFLPLLPALAFWLQPQHQFREYGILWFTIGILYAFLSLARRSFAFAVASALAGNFALWITLHDRGVFFAMHPQLWLIPVALVVLAAEHVNRERLTYYQSTTLRYLALIVIYLSSTADLFFAGVGHSVALPLTLAVLSVFGVLAGMLLRVRAFLFMGSTFLVLVVVTMIWHVGVNRQQTWLLWSCGILLGLAVLTLFGIFEKRRQDVLQLIEELKEWQ